METKKYLKNIIRRCLISWETDKKFSKIFGLFLL